MKELNVAVVDASAEPMIQAGSEGHYKVIYEPPEQRPSRCGVRLCALIAFALILLLLFASYCLFIFNRRRHTTGFANPAPLLDLAYDEAFQARLASLQLQADAPQFECGSEEKEKARRYFNITPALYCFECVETIQTMRQTMNPKFIKNSNLHIFRLFSDGMLRYVCRDTVVDEDFNAALLTLRAYMNMKNPEPRAKAQ